MSRSLRGLSQEGVWGNSRGSIIGLPWARAAFSIAAYTLMPFGYKAVPRDEYFGREDIGTRPSG